ncbi:NADH dehydrogenase subunit 6 (mitochondrion) [Armillaria borealis]|uniref:NADH-ubiquinone oxidoreductase chain 6 n=2 Tax=Armillaria TaxID=47424 RepID=A0A4D6FHG0_9AGAR|nr:NADH dehydrogenase subunit 6 [Armillaria borealis]YP_009631682.1 NADH dehydrogenase subunit 6 [Armillaria solidipes]QCB16415.1 NADH dehydrogenase subunit 6 [Armillaria borealis]QCB16462.1 NADH dehydrogenase subunit 6 [Armillaria solidipes]
MTNLSLIILTFGSLLSGVFTITSKNPVISILFLISVFVQAAIYLILTGVNFIGLAYIIIYVGAIAVLFLFVIMMLNINLSEILETDNQYTKNLPLAIAIGFLFIYNFSNILSFQFFSDLNIQENSYLLFLKSNDLWENLNFNSNILSNLSLHSDLQLIDITQIKILGYILYTYSSVLLIALGIILLLSMFATIIISKNENN